MTDGTDAAPPPPPPPPPAGDVPPTTTAPGGPTGPGWHPDPSGRPGLQRYWDGTKWTDHTHSTSPTAGQQAPQIKLPLIFRVWSWGCLGLTVIALIVLIAIFSFARSMVHGLTHPNTGKAPNLNEDITHSPGPRPSGLTDLETGVSFPYPGKGWNQKPARGPFTSMIVADPCGDNCYHGLFGSGSESSDAGIQALAATEGGKLVPSFFHQGAQASQVKSEPLTVLNHPAWQIQWRIAPTGDAPAATDWLLVIDRMTRGTGGVGEEYAYLYGTVDDGDPNLPPSVFDQVLKTIQIRPS